LTLPASNKRIIRVLSKELGGVLVRCEGGDLLGMLARLGVRQLGFLFSLDYDKGIFHALEQLSAFLEECESFLTLD